MAGPEEVVRFARQHGVPVRLFSDLGSVRTVQEVSMRMDRSAEQVGLCVLVTVRGDPRLVLIPGDRRVDGDKIAAHFGVRPSDVSLATAREAEEVTGYETGTIPPFGHQEATPVLIDRTVLERTALVFPAGRPDAVIEVQTEALSGLTGTEVGDWSVAKDEEA